MSSDGRRSLCRERGLKPLKDKVLQFGRWSLPMEGAWIETLQMGEIVGRIQVAPHIGSVD